MVAADGPNIHISLTKEMNDRDKTLRKKTFGKSWKRNMSRDVQKVRALTWKLLTHCQCWVALIATSLRSLYSAYFLCDFVSTAVFLRLQESFISFCLLTKLWRQYFGILNGLCCVTIWSNWKSSQWEKRREKLRATGCCFVRTAFLHTRHLQHCW